MEPIRLQKYFTDCDVLSRRAAEQEIRCGKVLVNGLVAEIGQKVLPGVDTVEWNGQVITQKQKPDFYYVMLNKPRGFLSSVSDDRGRRCVTELVSDAGVRLYPVGRLDMDSEGLLLMTNDGALTQKLTHPRHEIPKIYHVTLRCEITQAEIDALSAPMVIDGYKILPVKTELVSKKKGLSVVKMTLYEGRNRQIRKMCAQVGLSVVRLCRVAVGDLQLGHLAPGDWKKLTPSEVAYLKGLCPHSAGDRKDNSSC